MPTRKMSPSRTRGKTSMQKKRTSPYKFIESFDNKEDAESEARAYADGKVVKRGSQYVVFSKFKQSTPESEEGPYTLEDAEGISQTLDEPARIKRRKDGYYLVRFRRRDVEGKPIFN